jgi:hypothetical protein
MLRIMALSFPLTLIATPVSAEQRPGSIVFYSQPGFTGDRIEIDGARSTIGLPWKARSVQIADGDRWESCAGAQYRQPCFDLNADQSELKRPMRTVRSLRLANRAAAASRTVPGS